MERSVKAAKVLVTPQPDKSSPSIDPETAEGEEAAASFSSWSSLEAIEGFTRRLEDIIHVHGSAAGLLDKTVMMESDVEKMEVESKGDVKVGTDKDVSVIMQTLNKLPSAEAKLEGLVKKYTEMAGLHRCDEQKISVMQKKMGILLEERKQLQAEQRSSIAARCKLETLCRELQSHYNKLREETLQRCKEEEEKRTEMTAHFQEMLKDIQLQIEQHSARNDRLCKENSNLTEKLESLMNQCELRDESVEKINKHRDLQHKLTEAKLQQANAQLAEAEEKHKREKEYLLVQAAEWKLQAKTLTEQGTVMQAQLTLYAQKFDEFQATLAKSNEIYIRFKKEMDNMSEKMKKVEKESNVWKTRFENCNKALTDMIEERTEKGKDYELFVLKIHKLEKLCRSLQEERKGLYEKIKEVRLSNSNIPSRVLGISNNDDPDVAADKLALLTPEELQEIQEEDPVLTEDMSRLREQQAKLQEFAENLLTTSFEKETEEEEVDLEEDVVATAFDYFRTKSKVKEDEVSVPEKAAKSDVPTKDVQMTAVPPQENSAPKKVQIDENIEAPAPNKTDENKDTPISDVTQLEQKTEVKTQAEIQQVKSEEETQSPKELEAMAEPEKDTTDPQIELEPTKVEVLEETGEVKPEEDNNGQQNPKEEISKPSTSGQPTEHTAANNNSTKKQAPKKKKKKGGKNAS